MGQEWVDSRFRGKDGGEGGPPRILSPPPPFILSLSKDPLSLDGRGLEPAPYLIRGRGRPPFILSPPPPFILSLSKDPLSLDGRGLGEGEPPVHPEPVEGSLGEGGVSPTHRTVYIRFRSEVVGRVYEYDLRMRTYSEN